MVRPTSIYGGCCLGALSLFLACTPESTVGGKEYTGARAISFSAEGEPWLANVLLISNETTQLNRVGGVIVYRDIELPNPPKRILGIDGTSKQQITAPVKFSFGTKWLKLPQGSVVIIDDQGNVLLQRSGVDFQASESEFDDQLKPILLEMISDIEEGKKESATSNE